MSLALTIPVDPMRSSGSVYFTAADAALLQDRLEQLEGNFKRWGAGAPDLQQWAAQWLLTLRAMPSLARAMADTYYKESERYGACVAREIAAEVGRRSPTPLAADERSAIFGLQRDLILYPLYHEPAHTPRDARWIAGHRVARLQREAQDYTLVLRSAPNLCRALLLDIATLAGRAQSATALESHSVQAARGYASSVIGALQHTPGTPRLAVWISQQIEAAIESPDEASASAMTAPRMPVSRVRAEDPALERVHARAHGRPSDAEVRATLEDAIDLLHANSAIDPRCIPVMARVRDLAERLQPDVPVAAPLGPVVSLESALDELTAAVAGQREHSELSEDAGTRAVVQAMGAA